MPYLDVCSDGVEGRGPAVGEPVGCVFGADTPIPCPAGLWWSFEWVPSINDHIAVAQGHDAGMVWVSRRERRFEIRHPAPCGTNGVLVLSDGRILVSDCAPPIFGDGYAYFDYPNDVVVPMQQMIYAPPVGNPPVHNGVTFIRAYRHYDWEIAQTNLGDFYVAWNYAAPGTIWHVGPSGGSPVPPKIRQMADGTAIAALTAAPTGYFSHSSTWTPLVMPGPGPGPQPPDPPDPGPIPPGGILVTTPIPRPVWIGIDGRPDNSRPTNAGNCTWSPADHRPYFEGCDWLPTDPTQFGPLIGLLFMAKEWMGEDPSGDLVARRAAKTVALAKARGVPVVVYWDAAEYREKKDRQNGWTWSQGFAQAGCEVIHGVRAYPGDFPLQALTETRRQSILITPVYPVGSQDATERAQVEADRILMEGMAVGKLGYGQYRAPLWPALHQYWQAQQFPDRSGPILGGVR